MWRFASRVGGRIALASCRVGQTRGLAVGAVAVNAAGLAWCDAEEDRLYEEAKIKVYERWRSSATRAKEANAEGHKDEAERCFRAAVSDAELFTSRDPRLASSLNNLADFLRLEKRYAESAPLYARAVACFQKALGRDHPLLGLALHNQASLLVEMGELELAMPAFERSLKVKTRAFGAEHEECAKTLFHMAKLCTLQKQPERAEQLYSDALSIALIKDGVAGARPCRWRLQQSLVRMESSNGADAEQLHKTAVEQARAAGKPLVHVYEAYAKFLSAAGHNEPAMEMLDNALSSVKAEQHKVAILLRMARVCENKNQLLDRAVALVDASQVLQAEEKHAQLERIAIERKREGGN